MSGATSARNDTDLAIGELLTIVPSSVKNKRRGFDNIPVRHVYPVPLAAPEMTLAASK